MNDFPSIYEILGGESSHILKEFFTAFSFAEFLLSLKCLNCKQDSATTGIFSILTLSEVRFRWKKRHATPKI